MKRINTILSIKSIWSSNKHNKTQIDNDYNTIYKRSILRHLLSAHFHEGTIHKNFKQIPTIPKNESVMSNHNLWFSGKRPSPEKRWRKIAICYWKSQGMAQKEEIIGTSKSWQTSTPRPWEIVYTKDNMQQEKMIRFHLSMSQDFLRWVHNNSTRANKLSSLVKHPPLIYGMFS